MRKSVMLGAVLAIAVLLFWREVCCGSSNAGMGAAPPATEQSVASTNAPVENATQAHDPVAPVLLTLVVVLVAGKLGGEVLERLHQPAVLGELVFGVVIGNLALVGFHAFDYLKTDYPLRLLSEIGVILLLFQVGVETNVRDMAKVGISSFFVALFGVVVPFALGAFVSSVFMKGASIYVHIYVGAVLCATSVGITARVLQELGRLQTKEARIILGAAVIDDVIGLVVLAVVAGLVTSASAGSGGIEWTGIIETVIKATLFFIGAIVIGLMASPRLFRIASYLRVRGVLLITALVFCFSFSYLAKLVGLHPIVGAFAAGLVVEDVHYKDFLNRGEQTLDSLIRPVCMFLVPLFFVRMGLEVDLGYFGHVNIMGFALVLTLAAIIGKQVCSLGVMERGLDRISVGVGMIPRGEVGLIVAGVGTGIILAGEPVVSPDIFSACVIMVMITTLVTPPVLQYTLRRGDKLKQKREDKSSVLA